MPDQTLLGRRILVVEDDYMLADELDEALQGAGAIVLGPAQDPDSAMALLAAEPEIDAAVVDINLGDGPSYVVADELLRRGVPFAFTTGYDHDALPDRYQHLPRCTKPTSLTAVREALGW
jgi:DNA-binding NarL/FixJ family response regulator